MTAETRQALGKRIRDLREANHLSQEKFALMVNVERSYLSKLEQGSRNPSIDCVEKIAGGFDLSISELFDGLDRPRATKPPSTHYRYIDPSASGR